MSNRPLTKTEWLTSLEELWEAAQQPRKWVGLTDEEIWSVVSRIGTSNSNVNPYITIKDARAIEQRLKEMNT